MEYYVKIIVKTIGAYDKILKVIEKRKRKEIYMNALEMNSNKKLFLMSLPIFVEVLLQLLVGNIDQFMISQYSQTSVAAIVNGNQVMNLLIILLTMISTATTVVLTQYLGAGDKKAASKVVMVSFIIVAVTCIALTAFIIIFEHPILNLMQVESVIYEETYQYLTIVVAFVIVQGLYLNFASVLRSHTCMKEVMYVSILMNVLNVIGNAILINGYLGAPRLGLVGAAISTVCSKTIGLIGVYCLYKKKVDLEINLGTIRPFPKDILVKLWKIACPLGIESVSYQASQICILAIINIFGTMTTVTKGYCSILANFSYIYVIALTQAAQIILGYLIGERLTKEIVKRTWHTVIIAVVVVEVITLLLYFNVDIVIGIFTDDPMVIELARQIFFIEFFLEFGRAINICLTKALVSVGEVTPTIVIGIGGQWGVAFAGAYLFGVVLDGGLVGVWIAMAIDECVRGAIYAWRFKQGKWKKNIELPIQA